MKNIEIIRETTQNRKTRWQTKSCCIAHCSTVQLTGSSTARAVALSTTIRILPRGSAPPSELRRVKGGSRNPNSRESWLDVQARALWQAAEVIRRAWAD